MGSYLVVQSPKMWTIDTLTTIMTPVHGPVYKTIDNGLQQ